MNVCRKCNNANVEWNGAWMQCVNCGEVHERKTKSMFNENAHPSSYKVNNKSLLDIAALPLKTTLLGKVASRFNLMLR